MENKWLKCDFHIHTNFSDGCLSIHQIVDIYGKHGFDVIAITDHFFDQRSIPGLLAKKIFKKSLDEKKLPEYYQTIEKASQYAFNKYKMLVIPGLEICYAYRYHLLALGKNIPMRTAYIYRDIKKTLLKLRDLNCEIIIVCHPRYRKRKNRILHLLQYAMPKRYLWKKQKEIVPLVDAWEIANRHDLFNDISLKSYPFVANSDFHKPQDIYSWKTLVYAQPNLLSIKKAIKDNRVALTLFRK